MTKAATAAAPTAAAAEKPAEKRNYSARVAPELTAVSKAVPMPENRSAKRGANSPYPFDALTEVGMSFGVKNKNLKGMASIVSNQNKHALVAKVDANGNPVFKFTEMKDAAGNVTRVPTEEPEMVPSKRFFAVECDPKTDPDNASVRVFREL